MRPLDGVVVVSLEQAVAVPYATRLLADLGARVIKIERPGTGDFARHYDSACGEVSSYFAWTNAGKESVSLDVFHPDGREVLDGDGGRVGWDRAELDAVQLDAVVGDRGAAVVGRRQPSQGEQAGRGGPGPHE